MALYTLPVGGVEASQDGLTRSYPRDAAAAPAAGETAPSVSAAAAPSTSAACISQPLSSFPSQEATLSSLPLATPSTPMPLMMMALIQMTSLSWARSDVASSSPSSPPPSCPPAPAPAPAARAASAAPAAPAPAPASPDVNHDYKERRGNGSDGGPKKAMWPDSCSAEAESRGAPGGEVGGSGSYINPFGGDRVDASRGPVTGGQLRMLVPMLDLINHSGVRQKGGYTGDDSVVVSGANVRWELRPPAVGQRPTARSVVDSCRNRGSGSGRGQGQFAQRSSEALHGDDGQGDGGAGGIGSRSGWQIALVATADLATGQELLMCYDTTASNDSLALHYGFVENLNPNEDVQLYDSLEDALAWHREVVLAEAAAAAAAPAASAASGLVTSGGFLATRRMKSLGPDALATWYDTASAAAAASVVATSMACGDVVAEITTPVKLGRGNRLCPRLQAAFRHLAQSASLDFGTEDSDAGRIPGSTGSSGSTVASGGSSRDQIEGGETDVFPDIDKRLAELVVRRCVQLLQCRAPLLADLVELLLDAQQRQLKVPRTCPQEQQGVSGEPVQDGTAVWQALCQHFAEALAAKCADLQLLAGLDLPAVSAALARRGPTDQCGPPQVQHLDGRGCVVTSGLPLLTWQRRLALEYRVQKKTILWDYVLAHALD
ncbi:hypothetical protein Vafri_18612 [Volvox africanus]|nr:hypothetical protein Vafri_18612 [Volvox africanus]